MACYGLQFDSIPPQAGFISMERPRKVNLPAQSIYALWFSESVSGIRIFGVRARPL